MFKRLTSLAISFILVLSLSFSVIYGAQNPSHEEVEQIIEEVAEDKNIPAVILKAIAWKESNYKQFDSNGNPFVSYGNTGIMQVNKVHKHLDQNLLRNDIRYNIEAGANILLGRFNAMGGVLPKMGDANPNVLENWYIPLWGYNGWLSKNNPNVSGNKAYQEKVFELIRTKYNQPVTSVAWDVFPKSGLPSASLNIETPTPSHDMRVPIDRQDNPTQNELDRPVVSRSDSKRAIFKDITNHPKREYIETLYSENIISGVGNHIFAPDDHITREQVAKIVVEAMDLDLISKKADVPDWGQESAWATDYISTVYHEDIMVGDRTGIRPEDFLTREEMLVILYRATANNKKSNIKLNYADSQDISAWSMESIKYFTENKILTMNEKVELRPKDRATRGEVSEWVARIIMN